MIDSRWETVKFGNRIYWINKRGQKVPVMFISRIPCDNGKGTWVYFSCYSNSKKSRNLIYRTYVENFVL